MLYEVITIEYAAPEGITIEVPSQTEIVVKGCDKQKVGQVVITSYSIHYTKLYDIVGRVERIEYDPNRTAHIALVLYRDGERRYIIAPKGLLAGDEVISGREAAIKPGNCMSYNFV